MSRRSLLFCTIAAVAAGVLSIVAWDALKLTRKAPPLAPPDQRASMVIVEKQVRRLMLLRDGKPLATYAMSLGGDPVGHKQREGDGRTPEGVYAIDFEHPRSRFHLAMHISYPNAGDRDSAQRRGVSPGGDIMIHGLPNGLGWLGGLHRSRDWTDGCIAVTNEQIEEIWALVDVGTTVEIRP